MRRSLRLLLLTAAAVTPIATAAESIPPVCPAPGDVLFDPQMEPAVQTALAPAFGEVHDLTVSGETVGALYFDPTHGIAAFTVSVLPAGADAAAQEAAGRNALAVAGAISAVSLQSFRSWDGREGVLARYDWGGGSDLKAKVNSAVEALLGHPAGLSGLYPGVAGLAGPHELRVEYLRRSNEQAVVVGAAAQASGFDVLQHIRLLDIANGSALAEAHDTTEQHCDLFTASAPRQIDLLWVIDNSGGMDDEQAALGALAPDVVARLDGANVDWRAAVAYTDSDDDSFPPSTCLGAPGPGRRVICPFIRDADLLTNGGADCAYLRPGTCGSGTERGFAGAAAAIATFLSGSGCAVVPGGGCDLRPQAQLVVLFVTDSGEQTTTNAPGQPGSNVADWLSYFDDYDAGAPGSQRALLQALVCPLRPPLGNCGDNDQDYSRYERYSEVIRKSGGTEASVLELGATIDDVLDSVFGAVSPYRLTEPAISATLEVAIVGGTPDVPRSPANGYDYDGAARAISLFGSEIPAPGTQIAVAYRHWIDGDRLFADGFEAGDTSRWALTQPPPTP